MAATTLTRHTTQTPQRSTRWLHTWTTLALAMLSVAPMAHAAEAAASGHIKVVHGTVSLKNAQGIDKPVLVGATLHEGDVITTGAQAELHAEMVDGGYLAARSGAQIRIVAYHLSGTHEDRSWLELVRGGMRFVTGWVARSNPPAYRLKTPLATIGIRGTDFEVQHLSPEDSPAEEEVGTHMLVYEGTTMLTTSVGEVDVPAGTAAYALTDNATPRLHDGVPGFMTRKRGRFDGLVDEQAANIKAVMMAKLTALSLAKTGETLQQRLERFRAENPDSTLSDREVMERVVRRARQRSGKDGNGRNGRGGRR